MWVGGSVRAPVAGPQRQADTGWLFGLFSAVFAAALILDQLWWGGFQLASPHALVVAAALGVLFRPGSVVRFAALISVDIVSTAMDLPFVGDHRLLEAICGVVFLAYLGWTTLRVRRVPAPGELFAAIAPFLRASIIVVYAFAALAKMNTAFLDPATSCATWMSRQVIWVDPSLLAGRWQAQSAIWGTVLVEAALPILLAIGRTRRLALVLGIGFHTVLALAGNVPFSAVALAFYVAFLPPNTRSPLAGRTRSWRGSRSVLFAVLLSGWLVGAALGPTKSAPGLLGTPAADVSAVIGDGTRLVVVLLAVGGIVLLLSLRTTPGLAMHPRRPWRIGHPILAVGIVALVINGSCPYLGLKTDTSFAMFSGLRTEPGAWNSLVVPDAVRVFGYQDDLVRVVGSNDPALIARSSNGSRLVFLALDDYIRSHPGTVATYTTSGQRGVRTLGPRPTGPTFVERVAPFRDVTSPGRPAC